MKKITIISTLIAAGICSNANAGNIYMGPSVYLERISGHNVTYGDIHPTLAVGYATMPGDIYWGGELFYTPLTASMTNSQSDGAPSAKASRSYGASFLPGFMVNDSVLGYLRAGFISTLFTSPGATKTGVQLGLGFQTALTHNYMLRGEYDYSAYHSIHGLGSLKSNQIGVGFIYKFDN